MELRTESSVIEYEVRGEGSPVTLFAHGLGGGIAETRPLGSGVLGTKVFMHQRGHGHSSAWGGGPWDYPALAADLEAMADAVHATRFLGVSLGVGSCLALLETRPDRFERCVFFLPGALDQPRDPEVASRLIRGADLVDTGDLQGLQAFIVQDVPESRRDSPAAIAYAASRAQALVGTSVSRLFRALPSVAPVTNALLLREVTAQCLVLGQEGDHVHPAPLARELGAMLGPRGCPVHVFPEPGAMWTARQELRRLITEHLNAPSTPAQE